MQLTMSDGKQCNHDDSVNLRKHKQGASSFAMHNSELIFKELKLRKGYHFLDLGCGAGDYSLRAARDVGESGVVYALDKWSEVTDKFKEKINSQGVKNIRVMVSDILYPLPVEGNSIDISLLATVLHIPNIIHRARELFGEMRRVLKADGRLAIIEIKKETTSFGPPMDMRLSPQDVENLLRPFGFEKSSLIDLGCNYMLKFAPVINAETG